MEKENSNPPSDFPNLRKEVEELSALSKEETVRLVYDLRVQNDELRKTQFESQSLLAKAEQVASIGSWKLNYSTGEVKCSDELYRILGTQPKPNDDQNTSVLVNGVEAIHPDDRERATNVSEKAIAEKKPYQVEYRVVHSDGSVRNIITKGEVVCDDSGELIEVIGVIQDITERKQAEEKLKFNEQKYRTLVQNIPAMVYRSNSDWSVSVVNGLEKLSGYTKDDLHQPPKKWLDIIHPEDVGSVLQVSSQIEKEATELAQQYRIITKEGKTKYVDDHKSSVFSEDGKFIGVDGIVFDVTERKHAKDQVEESKLRYQTVADFTYDWETWIDPDGNYVYVSPSCERISGYKPEALITDPDLMIKITDPKDKQLVFNHFEKGEILSSPMRPIDFRITKKNGDTVWISHACQRVFDAHGNDLGRRGSNREITDQKAFQKGLEKAVHEKSILLHELNHRTKNNMTVVSSLLGLQVSNINDEKAKNALKDSQSRLQTMAKIHETLYQSDDLSSIDMQAYFTNLGRSIFQGYNVSGKIILKVQAEHIFIGMKQTSPLGLIVNELITNSLKYAFPDNQEGAINISLWKSEDQIKLEYIDNGVGIPKDFDIENADSLGLKLIKMLAEGQLDGSLKMESINGTKFTIIFNLEA